MKRNDKSYLLVSIILVIGSFAIMFFLLFSAVAVYHKTCCVEEEQRVHFDAVDSVASIIRSKYELKNIEKLDSMRLDTLNNQRIQAIISHVKLLEGRQSEILGDLRQESNNIINKVNGWLGFWIAILAILGGILPLIIQYTLYKRSEIQTKERIADISRKANACHLQLLVSTVSLQYELGIISDNVKKAELINILLSEMAISLREIYLIIEDNDFELDNEKEITLLNALIQYSKVVDYLIINTRSSDAEHRRLLRIQDGIKGFIDRLLNHCDIEKKRLRVDLINICSSLCSLSAKEEDIKS